MSERNTLVLLDYWRGGINIVLGVYNSLKKAEEFDFEAGKKQFIRTVCIGMNCPAFGTNQISGPSCTGPRQNVESDDGDTRGITVSALTEIVSYKKPIIKEDIANLKCQPKLIRY